MARNARVQRTRAACFACSRSPLTRSPLGGQGNLTSVVRVACLALTLPLG
jgi:hypothetical protein